MFFIISHKCVINITNLQAYSKNSVAFPKNSNVSVSFKFINKHKMTRISATQLSFLLPKTYRENNALKCVVDKIVLI